MAIQHRRGPYSQFDPTRLMPGELAVVLTGDPATPDGRALYLCFAAGVVKRMATYDDLYAQIEAIEGEIAGDLTTIVEVAAQDALDAAAEASSLADRVGYLEAVALDFSPLEMRVAALEECCGEVRESIAGLAFSMAAASGSWQYGFGTAFAPTAAACAVSGTTATTQGTVSGTTLTLD